MMQFRDPAPARDDGEDLQPFGFQAGDDHWLECFRSARASPPLGRIGRYEILAIVGQGGQGVVYRAREFQSAHVIAVKRLHGGARAGASALRRLHRELEAAAGLNHPGIVSLHGLEFVDDQAVIAMEWIDGEPIDLWARGRSVDEVLSAFLAVCDAVQHAHERGVLHRDLKPSNVLVHRGADGWQPVVLDFGLALTLNASHDEGRTFSYELLGTPAFASPEMVAGCAREFDVRGDVYALGVMLYLVLSGRMPYATDGPLVDTLQAIREGNPLPPSTHARELDAELDAIVLKAMARDKSERYRGVAEFADDLRRHMRGEAVLARMPGPIGRLRKHIARHRIGAALALAAAMVLCTFVAGMVLTAARAIQAERREADARLLASEVGAFLLDTLALSSPGQRGGDLSIVELLQESGRRASVELARRPRLEAEVNCTIGQTLARLWRWREAETPLRRAVELRRRLNEEPDESMAQTLASLGTTLAALRNPEAVDLQRDALALRVALHGEGHPLVAESRMRLGYALFRAVRPPRFDEAEPLMVAAIRDYRLALGEQHREVASCLHTLGYMRLVQGRKEEAETLYREAIEMLRALSLTQDPYYVECLHGYSSLLLQLHRYPQTLTVIEELMPLVEFMYGRDQLPVLEQRRQRALRAMSPHIAAPAVVPTRDRSTGRENENPRDTGRGDDVSPMRK
jgi:tRNA A-37 threonylcarbamoyl transferase component Bud32/tetratricopeptide (TPR) repeat protein